LLPAKPTPPASGEVHPDFTTKLYFLRLENKIKSFEDKYGKLSVKQKNHLKRRLLREIRKTRRNKE
tara:strand:+ start:381 stop:578 length:198 start_codon:yes stop_codon:yes gene_type:complete